VYVRRNGELIGSGQITGGGWQGIPYQVRMAGTNDYRSVQETDLENHPQQNWMDGMIGVINLEALRILNRSEATLHVYATLPNGEKICVRVLGIGSKICGTRMDNGGLQENIRPEWVTGVSAT
jgi:hypothetical protein